jgi:hypothetical protein
MYIETNSALLQAIIFQLSRPGCSSSPALTGDTASNLLGLRDLLHLRMISGDFTYGVDSDPLGFLLVSASQITLTKRGSLFISHSSSGSLGTS